VLAAVFSATSGELLVVSGHSVGGSKKGAQLNCPGSHFVVGRVLAGDAEGVHLALDVLHEHLAPVGGWAR